MMLMIRFGSLAILGLNQRNVLHTLQQSDHVQFFQKIETQLTAFLISGGNRQLPLHFTCRRGSVLRRQKNAVGYFSVK